METHRKALRRNKQGRRTTKFDDLGNFFFASKKKGQSQSEVKNVELEGIKALQFHPDNSKQNMNSEHTKPTAKTCPFLFGKCTQAISQY